MLGARYRLTGTPEIGHTATLYRAEELETGRAVVVRVFHEVGRNDRGRIQSFRRPASSRAPQLQLPSAFVAVHDCDLTDDGRLFLVTELVEGPSVADLLRRTPPLAPVRALELAMRIGEALEAALNLGLLDLRVAPGDIVVMDDGDRVKFLGTDTLILRRLGLADALAAPEVPGPDPRYASPEELAGLPATERSVIYRFGVLLYELLCGSPVEGTTPAEVRQLRPPPRRLRDRHRALPPSLVRLVSRMVDPDPLVRPVDLTSILNDLWEAASHLSCETPAAPADIAASSASMAPTTRVRRPRTRRWVLAALPILFVVGTLLAWPHLVRRPRSPTSVPASVGPVVDVAPPTAPLVPAPPLVVPPSDPGTSWPPGLPTPTPEQLPPAPTMAGGGSPARVGSNAPALPGVTQPEDPPAPPRAKTAPVREPPPSARPAETSALRRAAARPQPESTPVRTELTPFPSPEGAVPLPPVRPSPAPSEGPPAADPGAIIEWLVREIPRLGE